MELPFSEAEFLAVFARYNEAVWPLPVAFLFAAVGAAIGAWRNPERGSRPTLLLLGFLWLWMGIVYHAGFFRAINPAASFFAALFIVQGVLLLLTALRGWVAVRPVGDQPTKVGIALVVFALLIYPALAYIAGHRYPEQPTFGLPCPTTLYTLGVLLWVRPLRPVLFVVPLVWTLIGFSAALGLGMYEDFSLIAGGLATAVVLVGYRRYRAPGIRPAQ